MGYWSDEREDLKNTIRFINQTALNRAKENAELKEEIEKMKMKIKNLHHEAMKAFISETEEKVPIDRNQMTLPFSEWGHGRAMPRENRENPDGRWNWWGVID